MSAAPAPGYINRHAHFHHPVADAVAATNTERVCSDTRGKQLITFVVPKYLCSLSVRKLARTDIHLRPWVNEHLSLVRTSHMSVQLSSICCSSLIFCSG